MIHMNNKAMVMLITSVASVLAAKDLEIQNHHDDIDLLKGRESDLAQDLASVEYGNGELRGQITDLTERLQLAETSNAAFFNTQQAFKADNLALNARVDTLKADALALIERDNDLTFQLEEIKQGKPIVTATPENVKGLILAMLSGDTDQVALACHKLMDIPLVNAKTFAEETLIGYTALGVVDAPLTVDPASANDFPTDDEVSGVTSSLKPDTKKTAEEVEAQVG